VTGSEAVGGEPLLEVRRLRVDLRTRDGAMRPVDDVSFRLASGETLGLVGESGCGKTIAALSIMRLLPPSARIAGGEVLFRGKDLVSLSEERMRRVRGREISIVFQEPMSALNPVFTVGFQIAEAVRLHQGKPRKEALDEAVRMLDVMAIPDPQRRSGDYPHQLSGGMRQRVLIAMALACKPSLLIADEPTTALDVTIQAEILKILGRLQKEMGLSILLITHDLGVIAEVADRVAVMYCGRIVEEAPVRELFRSPQHPYTQGLLSSVPRPRGPGARGAPLPAIEGMVPDLRHLPAGCSFAPRCSHAHDRCRSEIPLLAETVPGRKVSCFLYPEVKGAPVFPSPQPA